MNISYNSSQRPSGGGGGGKEKTVCAGGEVTKACGASGKQQYYNSIHHFDIIRPNNVFLAIKVKIPNVIFAQVILIHASQVVCVQWLPM